MTGMEGLEPLVYALLHSLWQSGLVFLFVVAALRLIPAERNRIRYLLCVFALGGVLVSTVTTWAVLDTVAPIRLSEVDPMSTPALRSSKVLPVEPLGAEASAVESNEDLSLKQSTGFQWNWVKWVCTAWICGVVVFFVRMGRDLLAASRLRRDARAITNPKFLAIANDVLRGLGGGTLNRGMKLLVTAELVGPAVIGFLRPAVLVPSSMLVGVPEEYLRAVLAHEFAHILRWDYMVNIGQMVIEALLFFNPFVWWLSRQIRREREACCDDAAANCCETRAMYLEALINCVRGETEEHPFSRAALAAVGGEKSLLDRAKRLLHTGYRPTIHIEWPAFTGVLAASGIALLCIIVSARAAAEALTLTYRAEVPKMMWNGWGYSSPPDPDLIRKPAPVVEHFDLVESDGTKPRTFSGKVVGSDAMDGVEVGLVSLVGIHWNNPDAYQWVPVDRDGGFSITDARYNDANKALAVRGPDKAWTFLRYNFGPGESGKNIVLRPVPSKKVHVSASGASSGELDKVAYEAWPAYAQLDDKGRPLRRQRLGPFNFSDQKSMELVLPMGEVALFVKRDGWAPFYQIIDTRKADSFHFVLRRCGQMRIQITDGAEVLRPGIKVKWVNPAAPLSLGETVLDKDGAVSLSSLVPGEFEVQVGPVVLHKVVVKEDCKTQIVLELGKTPGISRVNAQYVNLAKPANPLTNAN